MIKFKELFEQQNLDIALFADALQMYTNWNDKDSIEDLLQMNLKPLFSTPKKLFRLVRGQDENDYTINKFGVTSASTKLSPQMIEEMKDMINQYKKQGNFYLQELEQAQGIDINKLSRSKLFKGKKRELVAKYDEPGNEPISALYDSFKQLKPQNEFLIFGDYKVTKTTEV